LKKIGETAAIVEKNWWNCRNRL